MNHFSWPSTYWWRILKRSADILLRHLHFTLVLVQLWRTQRSDQNISMIFVYSFFTGAKSTSAFRIEIHTQCQQVRQHPTCLVYIQLFDWNCSLFTVIDTFLPKLKLWYYLQIRVQPKVSTGTHIRVVCCRKALSNFCAGWCMVITLCIVQWHSHDAIGSSFSLPLEQDQITILNNVCKTTYLFHELTISDYNKHSAPSPMRKVCIGLGQITHNPSIPAVIIQILQASIDMYALTLRIIYMAMKHIKFIF